MKSPVLAPAAAVSCASEVNSTETKVFFPFSDRALPHRCYIPPVFAAFPDHCCIRHSAFPLLFKNWGNSIGVDESAEHERKLAAVTGSQLSRQQGGKKQPHSTP